MPTSWQPSYRDQCFGHNHKIGRVSFGHHPNIPMITSGAAGLFSGWDNIYHYQMLKHLQLKSLVGLEGAETYVGLFCCF
jgi:hypothetical protein